ncbi:molybdopterin molybdotransferase MoeA [Lutibacter sp.]|uniref:molybdopterin molybdotransferase MoeA n=1 Tax=Lutibacter sp. TaxID=1925666 RepID=UPI001A2A87CA|nr:molybdopterin molybdotransferase MoeA [Lutibacter sp.]MBI9040301.1 molybdopterin molybdotransferase MoeA [Lutibacter sp.]
MELTTVKEALDIILKNSEDFGVEEIDFLQSSGRILKENIVADRDFPPFNRVSMDGIAISSTAFNKGIRSFKIEGIQAAGSPQLSLKNTENCIEAMTGAVLPKNTDVVIQYELLTIENNSATVDLDAVKEFQNVHLKGLDRKQHDVLIPKDTLISAAEISVFATVGKATIKVAKQPKVMIVSTGNELVEVDQIPAEHQIRRSNVYALASLLEKLHIKSDTAHILDDKETLTSTIKGFLKEYDVLLFSGAVSKGKFDFIPEVLNNLGVEKLFHQVKQRPGKPFWFGKKQHKTVFAFPGNPVSTFVSCLKYFYPWYYKSVNLEMPINEAILSEDFYFKPNLTYFLQVKLDLKGGEIIATPIAGKGSGDLANLTQADAFLELPDDSANFTKGTIFPIIKFR